METTAETTGTVPTELRLACGHDVPHEIGTPIFNYYDMRAGTITGLADRPEPDTSGQLPNGEAWWVRTSTGSLDGSRMICTGCANRKGWLIPYATDRDESEPCQKGTDGCAVDHSTGYDACETW